MGTNTKNDEREPQTEQAPKKKGELPPREAAREELPQQQRVERERGRQNEEEEVIDRGRD